MYVEPPEITFRLKLSLDSIVQLVVVIRWL